MERDKSVIKESNVRNALKTLIFTVAEKRACPLEALWLVDQEIATLDEPTTPNDRRYALQSILKRIISEEFGLHRTIVNRSPKEPVSLTLVEQEIVKDAQGDNVELLSWSWLYHCFVQVNLGITSKKFWALTYTSSSKRRYLQNHAVERLARRLYDDECEARKHLRSKRLQQLLPPHVVLFGREQANEQICYAFAKPETRALQITGEAGIGKTALVAEYLRAQIKAAPLKSLIWINRPSSIEAIQDAIEKEMSRSKAIVEFPTEYQTDIILDDLTRLDDLKALDNLIASTPSATFYLIHTEPLHLNAPDQVITLEKLSSDAVTRFLRYWAETCYPKQAVTSLTHEEIAMLAEIGQGNPRLLLEALSEFLSPKTP